MKIVSVTQTKNKIGFISRNTLYKAVKSGKIDGRFVGSMWVINDNTKLRKFSAKHLKTKMSNPEQYELQFSASRA